MATNKSTYYPGRCLKTEELKAYTKNLVSKEEKQKMEQHIQCCDFCKDAIEGYALLKNNDFETRISLINRRIRKKSSFLSINKGTFLFNKNFHRGISFASIAAAIVIFLGTMIYINYSWNKYSTYMANKYIEENKTDSVVVKRKDSANDFYFKKEKPQDILEKVSKHESINYKEAIPPKITKSLNPFDKQFGKSSKEIKTPTIIPPFYEAGNKKYIQSFKELLTNKKIDFPRENIVLTFIVSKEGKIDKVLIKNNLEEKTKKKIQEIVYTLKDWKPATFNDQLIDYEMEIIIPII